VASLIISPHLVASLSSHIAWWPLHPLTTPGGLFIISPHLVASSSSHLIWWPLHPLTSSGGLFILSPHLVASLIILPHMVASLSSHITWWPLSISSSCLIWWPAYPLTSPLVAPLILSPHLVASLILSPHLVASLILSPHLVASPNLILSPHLLACSSFHRTWWPPSFSHLIWRAAHPQLTSPEVLPHFLTSSGGLLILNSPHLKSSLIFSPHLARCSSSTHLT
jgi:hypothetical protein